MLSQHPHIRQSSEIPIVEQAGSQCRRHLGALTTPDERRLAHQPHERGFGALRVLDDVLIDAGARVELGAHDGLELVVYVLQGEFRIEDDHGHWTDLDRDAAARLLLGHGVRHTVRNRSSGSAGHVLVAAVAAPMTNPAPRMTVGSLRHDEPGMTWFASRGADEHAEGSILLDSPVQMGLARLDPGVEHVFAAARERGVFAAVLEGEIEFGPSSRFVDAGGDARWVLESPLRMQGVSRSRVFVVEVPLGFAQELSGA